MVALWLYLRAWTTQASEGAVPHTAGSGTSSPGVPKGDEGWGLLR
jgi:hypothetical protein